MLSKEKISDLFRDFENRKILVIGDVMIDSYLWGKVERISPEAPVPIVSVNKRENRLGGAANVALNISAMGAEAILCSVIGNDDKASEFNKLLEKRNLRTACIYQSPDRITTTKFRVIGNKAQMLRVDEEITNGLSDIDTQELFGRIENLLEKESVDAIIFQDYNKGVLTSALIHKVIELANRREIPIVVDPKKKNFDTFQNVRLFKPNLKELKEGLKSEFDAKNFHELSNVIQLLHKNQNIDIVLTTLSDDGVFISARAPENKFETHHIPAHRRSISDVSGAGDTVISLATLCLTAGLPPEQIAAISNLGGGIVCEEVGVVPIKRERLFKEAINIFSKAYES